MNGNAAPSSSGEASLEKAGTTSQYKGKTTVYTQGGPGHSIFYVLKGMVTITIKSRKRRSAVVGMLVPGDFFHELGLYNKLPYLSTARTIMPSSILRIKKASMIRLLENNTAVTDIFRDFLLSSITRFREDLVDAHVNSSKQRLARTLLRFAGMNGSGPRTALVPRVSQQILSEIIGTTRSRTNFFMNGFRKRGYISYNGATDMRINSSLRKALLSQ